MRILLFVTAVLTLLFGLGVFASAKSAIHEIEAFVLFLISAVCMSGAGIVEAVNRLREEFKAAQGQVK